MNSRSSIAETRPQRPRRAFIAAAISLGILPFVALEIGLRLLGAGRPGTAADPSAGFGGNYPLFVRDGDVWRTSRAREPFFPPQEFPAIKPANGYRIFCFGGSTVYGHPYEWQTSFPQWLELELAASDPARRYQAVNCGGVSYASYRLVAVVREALTHQPDLMVIATGHNEFLEDRTYRSLKNRAPWRVWIETRLNSLHVVTLARELTASSKSPLVRLADQPGGTSDLSQEVKVRLDDRSGYASYHRDDAWRAQVTAQYEDSVRLMVRLCNEAKVPVLLVKLGSNLRDCPPYKSEHRPGLKPGEEADWQAAFDTGTRLESHDLRGSLAAYERARKIDADYALLSWRMARVLDRLGRTREAGEFYLRAKEDDVCPLRILTAFENILEKISAETNTPLVDAAAIFAALSPDRIPGNDWYLDHVHPSIGAHQKIARAIAATLRARNLVTGADAWTEQARQTAFQQHLEQLGPLYFSNGRRRVEWLENWARRERLLNETTPQDARGHLHLAFRRLDLGDETGARESIEAALNLAPGLREAVATRVANLRAQGRQASAAILEKMAAAR